MQGGDCDRRRAAHPGHREWNGGLTRSLAADHAADDIRVNCILVGMVETPHVAGLGEEVLEKRRLADPLQTTGTAWDVGWAAV